MPLYIYKCSECDEEFEKLVKRSEKDEVKCTKCETSAKRKEWGGYKPGLNFVGSGFHCNDYD